MAAEDVFGIVGTTQVGNFHVERVVAEGGFGVVYRALHGGFRAPVAIKCLKIPEQMSKQQRDIFLEKFREEAELMFRLSAAIPEVCRPLHVDVLHLGDGRFVPFLAMEWLEGESLDAIITRRREQRQPPLGLHKVVKMMRPIATALHKAHRFPGPKGAVAIIHRDLKPENLMVASIGGSESMKILDFGIAKAKSAASQAAGRVTGRTYAEDEMASFTPAYGAPEQWTPKTYGETGPWTDVWGLALTMVEALCGVPPIDGEPWVMRRTCLDEKRRPTPRTQGADVPQEVEKVFERALALDPRNRFKTIESFWSELERAMGLPITLGLRDGRREPGEHSGEEAPAPAPKVPAAAPSSPSGERLARIELQKVSVPASVVRLGKAAPIVPAMVPPVVREAPPSAAAAPVIAPHPTPAILAPLAPAIVHSPMIAAAPLRKPEPSGSWEFDLSAAAPSSAGDELDLPIAAEAPAPPPIMAAAPAPPSPDPPGPVRRASGALELFLPSRSDPLPSGGSLELQLPDSTDLPPVAAAAPSVALPAVAPPAAVVPIALGFDLNLPPIAVRPPSQPSTGGPVASAGGRAAAPSGGAFDVAPGSGRRPQTMGGRPLRYAAEGHDLRDRLRAPLGILLTALAVASLEIGYHRMTGGDLTFGPLRPFWIAAPLALFGVGFTLWRLMEDRSDE